MTKQYMEYKEFKFPDDIMSKLEKSAEDGNPMTLGEAGVFEWLTKQSKDDGWSVVWASFHCPSVVLERKMLKEE